MQLVKTLALVLTACAAFVLTGCSDSPSDVTKNFRAAVADGDMDGIKKYSTARIAISEERMTAMEKEVAEHKGKMDEFTKERKKMGDITIISEKIDGDMAIVTFKDADGMQRNFGLVKVDGKWKVDVRK